MARNGLTDRMVKQARRACVLIDGAGLRLRVTVNPNTNKVRKSWVMRVTVKGGAIREIGLGSANDISLAEARERAGAARKLARDGVDPVAARDAGTGTTRLRGRARDDLSAMRRSLYRWP